MVDTAEAAKRRLLMESLRAGRRVKIRAIGLSMMPAIWPGDVLVIEAAGLEDLEVGEVAVFERADRIFAHRLIAIADCGPSRVLVTRGDRMPAPDPDVCESELLGRVAIVERAGREIRITKSASLADKIAAKIVSFDRGVALFLAVARWMGRTDYPLNLRQVEGESMSRAI